MAQASTVRAVHGEDAEVVKDPVVFSNTDELVDYIRNHSDSPTPLLMLGNFGEPSVLAS